jgi:hypothetical protein
MSDKMRYSKGYFKLERIMYKENDIRWKLVFEQTEQTLHTSIKNKYTHRYNES